VRQRLPTLLLLPLIAVILAGCGSQRDEVPGNIQSGSIESVTNRVDGFGDGRGDAMIDEIGVVPVIGQVKPTIPLVHPPEVVSFYVFPRKSRDGLSFRDGVWIHRVVRQFAWGVDEAMRKDRLKLSSLANLRLDDNGQLVVDQAKTLEPDPADVERMRDMARQLPWRESGQSQVRTTVVYPNGQAVSSLTPSPQAAAVIGPTGTVNMGEIERAMREAQHRIQEAQRQPPSPAAAAAGAK